MHDDRDPIRSALRPLRSRRWERSVEYRDMERKLMRTIEETNPRGGWRRRGWLSAALVLLLAGVAWTTSEWWEAYTVYEEDLGDGTYHLKVTDPDGNVDFDEVLEDGSSVMQLEEGGYIIVEPASDDEVDEILEDLEGDLED